MIDTLRVQLDDPPSFDEEQALQNLDSDWTFSANHTRISAQFRNNKMVTGTHHKSGLHIRARDRILKSLSVSLPRLLYGSNGFQIKSDDELERGKGILLHWVRHFSQGATPENLVISRIDLALTLPLNPRMILALHRHAAHPMVRRPVQSYRNPSRRRAKPPHIFEDLNTVRFHGVNTTISLYDKAREMETKHPRRDEPLLTEFPNLRVEIQLKGKKHIAKLFGLPEDRFLTVSDLNCGWCYSVYRGILLQFERAANPPPCKPGLATCLAVLQQHPETWHHWGGTEPIDWYATSNDATDRAIRDMRKQISTLMWILHQFHWSEILPEQGPPALVDIAPDGTPTPYPRAAPTPSPLL